MKLLKTAVLALSMLATTPTIADEMRTTEKDMFACETLEQMATAFKVLSMRNDDRRNYYMKALVTEYGQVCYPLYEGLEFVVIDVVPPFIQIEIWSDGEPHHFWSVEPSYSEGLYQVDFDNWYE
ncbi:MAG: hypothetical protein CL489_08970 [Acidobacteria bacterium]|nr:hypothetical protein [Acidobacteriota bacterium]|tara:strand:- start:35147 stop:35518 length:372 start_codon:yes stop_codon:yes gene_type:complete